MKSDLWLFFLGVALLAITAPGCAPSRSSNLDTDSDLPPGDSSDGDTDTESSSGNTDTEDSSGDTDTEISSGDTDLPALWGWISAIEWNDTCDQWSMKTDWVGGVRAYFAETASYPRALPHTLDFLSKGAAEEGCQLYESGIVTNCSTPDDCFSCIDTNFECAEGVHWCDQDQQCQGNPMGGTCQDLPRHSNLGKITLTGFKEPLTLEPDEYDRYYVQSLTNPNDLFDEGDVLTAKTEGGALPILSFSTKGVAPLELPTGVVELRPDYPAQISWTPADADSRIQIVLTAGSHDPNPLITAIVCDVPDNDGSVEIPASLVNGFFLQTCREERLMKCSRITRYTRDVQTIQGKELELFVGSARNLQRSIVSK